MTRAALAGALALVACDNTVFHSQELGYEANWFGVQVFMHDHCFECHRAGQPPELPDAVEADLVEERFELVVPGDAEGSVLWQVVAPGEWEPGMPHKMPPGQPLPPPVTEHVYEWIEKGAPL